MTRDQFYRLTIGTVIVIVFIFALAVSNSISAQATWEEAEHLDAIALEALAAVPTEERPGDPDVLDALQGELYAASQDEQVSPVCRHYADVILLNTALLEAWYHFPESASLAALTFEAAIPELGQSKSRCQFGT